MGLRSYTRRAPLKPDAHGPPVGDEPGREEAGGRLRLALRQAGLSATVGSKARVCGEAAGLASPTAGLVPLASNNQSHQRPSTHLGQILTQDRYSPRKD